MQGIPVRQTGPLLLQRLAQWEIVVNKQTIIIQGSKCDDWANTEGSI